MECKFVVGQKVVCIGNRPWVLRSGGGADRAHPQPGHVYTISEIYPSDGTIYLRFRPEFYDGYFWEAFRPVQERKTDISVFTAMLHRAPELV